MSNTPRTDAIWLQWFGEPVDAMENEVAIRKWLYDPLCKIERDLAAANARAEQLRRELTNIATANPRTWDADQQDQF